MNRSQSSDNLFRWVDPGLFALFGLGTLFISLLLFLSVGIGEGYFSRQLCFGAGCWDEFVRLFSLPLAIFSNATKLVVAYSAAVGILVAVNNLIETKRLAASQVHLAHKSSFETFVAGKLIRYRHLDASSVSVSSWYASIYPLSNRGNLTVGDDYRNTLTKINKFVVKTDAMIRVAGRGYRHDRYQGPVMDMLSSFGIVIAGSSRLDFFSLEREAYMLINEVNFVFCNEANLAHLSPATAHRIP